MEKYRWSEEIFDDLRSNIIAALDLSREQNDEEVCRFIEKEVEEYSRKNLLTLKEREQLEHLLFNSLRKYDAIQELLEDPEVTEIMINGASRIFYEKKGKLFRARFISENTSCLACPPKEKDRKSTRLNSSHRLESRMPSSA